MKKVISLILAFTVSAVSFAQNIEDTPEIRASIEYVFEFLDFSRVPSGYLRDYATDLVDLDTYNGRQLLDSNYVDMPALESIMRSLRSSKVCSQNFPDVSTLMTTMVNQTSDIIIPVGGTLFRYNYIREDAVTGGYLYYANGQVTERSDEYGNWINPYLEDYVFALAPSSSVVGVHSTFTFGEFMLSNIDGAVIEVDLGDGSGYHTISATGTTSITASYPGTGMYEIRARASFGGTTLHAHSEVYAVYAGIAAPDGTNRADYCSTRFSAVYQGKMVSALVYHPQDYIQIRKPFIVVEGFDPIELGDGEGLTNFSNEAIVDNVGIAANYEIIYIDWLNSEADIRANALILEQVISYVNSRKVGNERNVVMGYSMGGLVARYALRDMELHGVAHEVSTYISYDTPHFGVNIPLGAQYAINDILFNTHITPLSVNALWKAVGMIMQTRGNNTVEQYHDIVQKYIQATSVKQMLINYVNSDLQIDNSVHEAWQTEIESMGFPVGDAGYPMAKLAVSNGGQNMLDPSHKYVDGYFEFVPSSLFNAVYGTAFTFIDLFDPALWVHSSYHRRSSLLGRSRFNGDLEVSQYRNHGQTIYSFDLTYTKKFLWLFDLVTHIHHTSISAPSTGVIWDTVNGSYYDYNGYEDNNVISSLWGSLDYDLAVRPLFLFVPTASSIALGGSHSALSDSDYRRTDYISSETPFDAIYHNSTWTYHTNDVNGGGQYDWIYNYLNNVANLVGPRTPTTGQQYTVDGYLAGHVWSTSDPSVASIDSNGVITVHSTGFTTVQVTGTNCFGNTETLSMRVMTGIPAFTIYGNWANIMFPTYEAVCSDPEFFDFSEEIGAVYYWGEKGYDNNTTWSSGSSLSIRVNSRVTKWLYFIVVSSFMNSETYSTLVKRVQIFEPMIVGNDSTIFVNNGNGEYIGVKGSSGDEITYVIENHIFITFDHVPDAEEFCRELRKNDEFMRMLKSLKPWGEEECQVFEMSVIYGGETIESSLKFIYMEDWYE